MNRDFGLPAATALRVGEFLAAEAPSPWSPLAIQHWANSTAFSHATVSRCLSEQQPISNVHTHSAARILTMTAFDARFEKLHQAASQHFALCLQWASVLSPKCQDETHDLSPLVQDELTASLTAFMSAHITPGWTWLVFNGNSRKIEVLNTSAAPGGSHPLLVGLFPMAAFNVSPRAFLAFGRSTKETDVSPVVPPWSRRARIGRPDVPVEEVCPSVGVQRAAFMRRLMRRIDWNFVASQLSAAQKWADAPERRDAQTRRMTALQAKVIAVEMCVNETDASDDTIAHATTPQASEPVPARGHDIATGPVVEATVDEHGTSVTQLADGSIVYQYVDGSRTTVQADGTKIFEQRLTQEQIDNDVSTFTTTEFSSGDVHFTYAFKNGLTIREERKSEGGAVRSVTMDADGNVIADSVAER